ncbi:adenylyl-sulfate kinase [Burkholderia mayonis]|uniref:Adenylyl-sulfate kinase n=1 Tax=Burkholderia mayonis TaxID=1385591 RepID=A0A1B4G0R8_9BURK|nr:adenylyl-sulfate kinase [Burkholderia mayonis]AOJ09525.1 adenylyl-sulfate kinase [Burkholderia mayonis]KVE47147.1 adenylyl-sulfate kinase [Burkholderia mayonis]
MSIAAMNGLRRTIAPAHRVLDTCGSGAAGLLALRYGAERVVALTAGEASLVRAQAEENGFDGRMSFIEADRAATLADREGRFDVVLGLTPAGPPELDLHYGFRLGEFARRLGTANVAVVPNGVRYGAQLVEWGDAGLLEADVATRKRLLESRYEITFDSVLERVGGAAALRSRVRPDTLRALCAPLSFLTCRPGDRCDNGAAAPETVVLTAAQGGRADGVVWTQELIHDGIVVKRIQGCSWLDARVDLDAGDAIAVPVADMARAASFDDSEAAPWLAPAVRATGAPAPLVFWLTGISGAGKTTIATCFKQHAEADAWPAVVLDGDTLRGGLNADLGFSDADRAENVRRIAEVAALMADTGLLVVVSCISPKWSFRETARTIVGAERFVEVFVDTPPSVAEARDPKGLYRRARAGLVASFTGVDSDYEPPPNPQMRIDTTTQDVESATQMLRRYYIDARLSAERAGAAEVAA